MKAPLCIDLFCGTFGWSAGWLELGGRVVGFDLDHQPYHGPVPQGASLVIQDVLTVHGSQFREASLILASPPCQEFSFMSMPWTRAKAKAARIRVDAAERARLTALFDACFRIQREACEAAGRHIPLVVENVRGAQPWVGRAKFHFGSFYLWGDVPALMPFAKAIKVATMGAGWYPPDHPKHVPGLAFNGHAERAIKNTGGSWFAIGSPGQKELSRNPVHEAVKARVDGLGGYGGGFGWDDTPMRRGNSKSTARKAASAHIAKIPIALSRHIACVYYPTDDLRCIVKAGG